MDQLDMLSMKLSMDLDDILEKAEKAEKVVHLYETSIYNQGNGYDPEDLLYAHSMLDKLQKIALSARQMKDVFDPDALDLDALKELEKTISVDLMNRIDKNDRILREKFPNLFRQVDAQ